MLHALGSVGVGTVVAAVLVGTVLKGITKVLGKQQDAWLGISVEQPVRNEQRFFDASAPLKLTFSNRNGERELDSPSLFLTAKHENLQNRGFAKRETKGL